jgi:hypothetical protein
MAHPKTASELTRNGVRKVMRKLTKRRREAEREIAFLRFQTALLQGQGFKALMVLLK